MLLARILHAHKNKMGRATLLDEDTIVVAPYSSPPECQTTTTDSDVSQSRTNYEQSATEESATSKRWCRRSNQYYYPTVDDWSASSDEESTEATPSNKVSRLPNPSRITEVFKSDAKPPKQCPMAAGTSRDAEFTKSSSTKKTIFGQPVSEASQSAGGSRKHYLTQTKGGSSKATQQQQIRHRRSSAGYSMTKGAIDSRKRTAEQQRLRARVVELLDAGICAQVEREGGITPEGRLYKAIVRTLEAMYDAMPRNHGEPEPKSTA